MVAEIANVHEKKRPTQFLKRSTEFKVKTQRSVQFVRISKQAVTTVDKHMGRGVSATDDVICRICLGIDGILYENVCNCRGSVGFIHKQCIERYWSMTGNRSHCDLCLANFQVSKSIFVYKFPTPSVKHLLAIAIPLLVFCFCFSLLQQPQINLEIEQTMNIETLIQHLLNDKAIRLSMDLEFLLTLLADLMLIELAWIHVIERAIWPSFCEYLNALSREIQFPSINIISFNDNVVKMHAHSH